MQEHETVKLWYEPYKDYIDIDRNIAPLINEIWKAGIETNNSCEDNISEIYDDEDICMWISFDSEFDMYHFLTIIFDGISKYGEFFARTNCNSNDKFKWKYSIWIVCDTNKSNIIRKINIFHSVRFPRRDYSYILQKMCMYNYYYNQIDIDYDEIMENFRAIPIILETSNYNNIVPFDGVVPQSMNHKTVKLWNNYFKQYIDIDVNIAQLIDEIWKANIATCASCENYSTKKKKSKDKLIWIEFCSGSNLEKFLEIIIGSEDIHSDFYNKVHNWKYKIDILRSLKTDDLDNENKIYKKYNCVKTIYIVPSVKFSKCDYNYVLNKLIKHNTKI